ncbi:SpoIID/LytB domain-containing protein [Candidatus Omnitrophota bacterium]
MRLLILSVSILLLGVSPGISSDLDSYRQAASFYNQAKFSEAVNLYKDIIKADPKQRQAYLNLACLYKDLAEYEQAIDVIKKLPEFIRDIRAVELLARLYYLKGEPKQAISYLSQALSFTQADSRALFYLGLCNEDIGQLREAEEFYSQAVELNPDNVLAYLKLGDIYYQGKRLKQATQAYEKVISLDPSITEVRSKLADCFGGLGQFQDAYEQYAKYVAIHPEDALAKKNLQKIKEKLGEGFFKRKDELALLRRSRASIRVKPSKVSEQAPPVRVGIAKIGWSIEFKTGSPFEIIDAQSSKVLASGKGESMYSLIFSKGGKVKLRDQAGEITRLSLEKKFLIKNQSANAVISVFDLPVGAGTFWAGWRDQQYRGIIEVLPESDGFWLINLVNLEEYLYGVLPSEMPSNWPSEALCAQAIAARTWAIKNKSRHAREGFNFCSTVHCQVYKGAGAENSLTSQAVDATAGLVVTYNNQPMEIFYSNNCGGCTQSGVVDAQEKDFAFPLSPFELDSWLLQRPEAFCNLKNERSANFRWVRFYKRGQLKAMLSDAGIDIGEPLGVIAQSRTISGHLLSLKIKGSESSQIIEGEYKIRKILGNLFSAAFKIEVKYINGLPQEFIFFGAGFGHGKGLCQTGIKGMALGGYSYHQILGHYYPDAKIERKY